MIDFLKKLLAQLFNKYETPGWIPDEIDVRDAQYDVIFGAAIAADVLPESVDWTGQLRLRDQQGPPFCVPHAICALEEREQLITDNKHLTVLLSPRDLGVRAGVNTIGCSIRVALEALRKDGVVLESECPYNPQLSYSQLRNTSFITGDQRELGKNNKIESYATIDPWNKQAIKHALSKGPILLGLYLGNGWRNGGIIRPAAYRPAGHLVVLAGYTREGNWIIGDSLGGMVRYLDKNYPMSSIYTIVDLPSDWKEIQEEQLYQSYSRLLKERFGQPRNILVEQTVAREIDFLMRGNKSPALAAAVSRYAICMYAAATYSGYSVQEVMDFARYYAKTGKHLFDLNKEKP